MAVLDLTNPVNGTLADATLIANNNNALENLLNGNVDSGNLANNSVGTSELQDLSVTTPKLADGAVTTPKIADGAVTAAKFGPGALPGSALPPTQGLNPPASPAVGAEWIYPTGYNTVWKFSYQPSLSAANPWLFIGGAPVLMVVHSTLNFNATPGGWVTNGNWCPVYTIPRSGVYYVEAKTTFYGADGAGLEIGIGSGSFLPSDGGEDDLDFIQVSGNHRGTVCAGNRQITMFTPQTITLAYRASGVSPQMNHTHLSILPMLVV